MPNKKETMDFLNESKEEGIQQNNRYSIIEDYFVYLIHM